MPGWGTLSPTMSCSPTSPALHVLPIPFWSVELSGFELTISVTWLRTVASIVITQILINNGRHQISYLLSECFIWLVRTSNLHLQSLRCSHYSGFGPGFRHTTSRHLCLSLSCSHHQLTLLGIRLIIYITKALQVLGLIPWNQWSFKCFTPSSSVME